GGRAAWAPALAARTAGGQPPPRAAVRGAAASGGPAWHGATGPGGASGSASVAVSHTRLAAKAPGLGLAGAPGPGCGIMWKRLNMAAPSGWLPRRAGHLERESHRDQRDPCAARAHHWLL